MLTSSLPGTSHRRHYKIQEQSQLWLEEKQRTDVPSPGMSRSGTVNDIIIEQAEL